MQNKDEIRFFAVHSDDDVIPDEGDSECDQIEIPDFEIPINGTGDNDNQERRQQGGQLRLLQGPSLQMLGEGTIYFTRSFVVSRYFQEYKERMRNAENEVLIFQPQEEEILPTSSTPIKEILTEEIKKQLFYQGVKEGRNEMLLLLNDKLSPETMKEVLSKTQITPKKIRRLKERRERGLPLAGMKRGKKKEPV